MQQPHVPYITHWISSTTLLRDLPFGIRFLLYLVQAEHAPRLAQLVASDFAVTTLFFFMDSDHQSVCMTRCIYIHTRSPARHEGHLFRIPSLSLLSRSSSVLLLILVFNSFEFKRNAVVTQFCIALIDDPASPSYLDLDHAEAMIAPSSFVPPALLAFIIHIVAQHPFPSRYFKTGVYFHSS